MPAKLIFPDDVRPDFEGFSDAAFGFLKALARNNERGWFNGNREAYETEVRFPLECLVAEFRPGGAGKGLPVRGDPSKAIFRIYRDIRFSKNKLPYKTHAGAVLSRSGARGEPGVVYIHIQPGNCFVSAGFWRLDPPTLTAWRRRMVDDPEEWLSIVEPYADGKDAAYMRTISALKTMPRGFKQDAELAGRRMGEVEVFPADPGGRRRRRAIPQPGRDRPRPRRQVGPPARLRLGARRYAGRRRPAPAHARPACQRGRVGVELDLMKVRNEPAPDLRSFPRGQYGAGVPAQRARSRSIEEITAVLHALEAEKRQPVVLVDEPVRADGTKSDMPVSCAT